MTQKQLVKFEIINKAISGFITSDEAAQALGLSIRQIKRLKKDVKIHGAAALVHKNSLRPPYNALPIGVCEQILELWKADDYSKFNFFHFRDLLDEYHNIKISYKALHKLLTDAGFKSPNTRVSTILTAEANEENKQAYYCKLMQYLSLGLRVIGKKYSIHCSIDDATGQITALFMCKNECLYGYFKMLKQTIDNYGIPVSVYADRHTIFQSPNKKKSEIYPSINVKDTQFGKALKDLCIELISAQSPQAKGRIERLWGTLQGRLPTEFAIRSITTINEANEFLKEYIYIHNSQFAVEPEETDSVFRRLHTHLNLDYILCIREKRVIDAGDIFSYMNKTFKVEDGQYAGELPAKTKVEVLLNPDIGEMGIKVRYKNLLFDVTRFIPPKRKVVSAKKTPERKWAVPKNHLYKYGPSIYSKLDYSMTYTEIMHMLEDAFLK